MEKPQFTKEVKCIVWDLDNTIWNGILLESHKVQLKTNIKNVIEEFDARGILQAIASKNNHDDAMAKLQEFGIDHYFLYPEINWNPKSESIRKIQKKLNIGMDSIVFIDDQPFERDEVAHLNPEVETIDADNYNNILSEQRFNPKFITQDSKRRRLMYSEEMKRNIIEDEYQGTKEEFLATLNMEFIIKEAKEEDLQRAEELTVRTNQLNATGRTYDYETLKEFMSSKDYKLYICELTDKYGSYGKIGLALIELKNNYWHLKMLLMSCRVLSRSVGSVLLSFIMEKTKHEKKKLLADFKQTSKNKLMYATFKFGGFDEFTNDGEGNITFVHDLRKIQKIPPYISVSYI